MADAPSPSSSNTLNVTSTFNPNHIKRRLTIPTSVADIRVHDIYPPSINKFPSQVAIDSNNAIHNSDVLQNSASAAIIPRPHERFSSTETSSCSRCHCAQKYESRCLSEVATNLFVAFEDDRHAFSSSHLDSSDADGGVRRRRFKEEMRTPSGEAFTHIIAMQKASSLADIPIRHAVGRKTGVHLLSLTLSPYLDPTFSCFDDDSDSDHDGGYRLQEASMWLSVSQLYAIQDFIASTGYTLCAEQDASRRCTSTPSHTVASTNHSGFDDDDVQEEPAFSRVRILITVPRDRRQDAMCAAAFSLAWDLWDVGFWVEHVVASVDGDYQVLPVWRNVVGKEAARYLQDVLTSES